MAGSMVTAGAVSASLLLDIVPIIAGIILLIAFIRGRSSRIREEQALKEIISVFTENEKDERRNE